MAEHLTGKQKLFVEEYLVDLNASRAAVRAGYRGKWAGACGRRNLQKPHVRAAIDKAQAPRLAELDLDARRVLAELTRIAQANVLDYMRIDGAGEPIVDFRRLDRARASALSEVVVEEVKPAGGAAKREVRRVRFRLHDKLAALDKLAKHFGLYRDRVRLETADGADGAPHHDLRQVARAVIAILETARLAEDGEDAEGAGVGA
jgi:phage terminase small subunit